MRYEINDGYAYFNLRDYLTPGGLYSYDDIYSDMENALKTVGNVMLWSVPGFLMLSGSTELGKKPWSKEIGFKYKYFKTAREALKF